MAGIASVGAGRPGPVGPSGEKAGQAGPRGEKPGSGGQGNPVGPGGEKVGQSGPRGEAPGSASPSGSSSESKQDGPSGQLKELLAQLKTDHDSGNTSAEQEDQKKVKQLMQQFAGLGGQ